MIFQNIAFIDVAKLALAIASAFILIEIVFALSDVLLIFFTSVILAIATERLIDRLEAKQIPRTAAAIGLYAAVFIGIMLLLYAVLPPLAFEFRSFVTSYPAYSEALLGDQEAFQITPYLHSLSESFAGSPEALLSTIFKTFGGFASFLAVFFVAFFLNVQKGGLRSFAAPLVPEKHKQSVTVFFDRVQERVSSWLWGKFLSSLLVGLITFVGLLALGIPYALILAVLAIFLNFIPFVGPIVAAVPAAALGFAQSGLHGIIVILLYFFVNGVLESFVFGPILMRRAVQINPALLILFVISGAYLGGVLGIIIAIPTAAVINLAAGEYLARKQRQMKADPAQDTEEGFSV